MDAVCWGCAGSCWQVGPSPCQLGVSGSGTMHLRAAGRGGICLLHLLPAILPLLSERRLTVPDVQASLAWPTPSPTASCPRYVEAWPHLALAPPCPATRSSCLPPFPQSPPALPPLHRPPPLSWHSTQPLVELHIFAGAQRVVEALRAHNCGPALAWCEENRARLRKAKSRLEFKLRVQVRQGLAPGIAGEGWCGGKAKWGEGRKAVLVCMLAGGGGRGYTPKCQLCSRAQGLAGLTHSRCHASAACPPCVCPRTQESAASLPPCLHLCLPTQT